MRESGSGSKSRQVRQLAGGEELQGPETATTIRRTNGKDIVTDRPFIESKEVLGGLAIVDV
jgi:hypothetical protein